VLNAAKGILRRCVDSAQIVGPCTALIVKYIAKSAAKNMSSLESQTIVPTATALGRVILWCDTAVDMEVIIPENVLGVCLGSVWNPSFLPLKR
jgi:hypothetical protein